MSDQLKLQIQIALNKTQVASEIKKQIGAVQNYYKVELGFEIKDKQALKSYEQMQDALGKTAINKRNNFAKEELAQAKSYK